MELEVELESESESQLLTNEKDKDKDKDEEEEAKEKEIEIEKNLFDQSGISRSKKSTGRLALYVIAFGTLCGIVVVIVVVTLFILWKMKHGRSNVDAENNINGSDSYSYRPLLEINGTNNNNVGAAIAMVYDRNSLQNIDDDNDDDNINANAQCLETNYGSIV